MKQTQELESRKAYTRPVLVKQGRVEELTQTVIPQWDDCSKPVR